VKTFLHYLSKWPVISLLVLISVNSYLFQYVKKIQVDTSFDRLLDPKDPEKVIYDQFVESFSDDATAFIFFKDPEVFTKEKIKIMKDILNQLRAIPEVHHIESLFTSTHVHNDSGLLDTSPVFYSTNLSTEDRERALKMAELNPMIHDRLFHNTESSKDTLFIISLKSEGRALREINVDIEKIITPFKKDFAQLIHSGHVALRGEVMKQIIIAQEYLLPLVITFILLFVWIGVGHWSAPVLLMGVYGFTMLSTIGMMGLLGLPIQMMTSSSSIIVFVLGSTELVHFLDEYAKNRRKGHNVGQSLQHVADNLSYALLMTAVTTIAGFLSISINDILMLKEFGIITAMALTFYFVYLLMFVSAFYCFVDRKEKWPVKSQRADWTASLRPYVQSTVSKMIESKWVIPGLCLISLIMLGLSTLVYSENDSTRLFQESSKVRKELDIFQDHYHGINTLNVVIEAKDSAWKDYPLWKDMWRLEKRLESLVEIDQVDTMAERFAHINREMNDSKPESYIIPENKNLISQYLLMMTRDEVKPFLSSDYKKAVMIIRHSKSSSIEVEKLLAKIEAEIKHFEWASAVKVSITSKSWLNFRAGQSIVSSQTSSLSFMVLFIFLMLSIFFKSFKMGLLALPPNILPALFLFAFMGLFGIPLNIGTCTIAAVTLGLAVDDTIHFFIRYAHEELKTDRPWEAARNTLFHEMNAILTTSISLAIGLSILGFSVFVPLDQFGLLSAMVLLFAVMCDLLVTPYILVKFKIHGIKQFFQLDNFESIEEHVKHGPLMKYLGVDGVKRLLKWSSYIRLDEGEQINLARFPDGLIVVVKDQFHIGKTSLRENEKGQWMALRKVKDGDSFVVPQQVEDGSSLRSMGEGVLLILDQKALSKCKGQDPGFYLQVYDMMKQVQ